MLISVLLVACNNVNAQTLKLFQMKSAAEAVAGGPQIMIGGPPLGVVGGPVDIRVNHATNKIYVLTGSGTVSVINSDSGNTKTIRVGAGPSIAIDESSNKIYVANGGSNSVSVIDGYNDSKIKDIAVGGAPDDIVIAYSQGGLQPKLYVANGGSNSVSVIDGYNYSKIKNIPLGIQRNYPTDLTLVAPGSAWPGEKGKIYVARPDDGVVSVINGSTDKKEPHDISVGCARFFPGHTASWLGCIGEDYKMVTSPFTDRIYVIKNQNVSVISKDTDRKEKNDIMLSAPRAAAGSFVGLYLYLMAIPIGWRRVSMLEKSLRLWFLPCVLCVMLAT